MTNFPWPISRVQRAMEDLRHCLILIKNRWYIWIWCEPFGVETTKLNRSKPASFIFYDLYIWSSLIIYVPCSVGYWHKKIQPTPSLPGPWLRSRDRGSVLPDPTWKESMVGLETSIDDRSHCEYTISCCITFHCRRAAQTSQILQMPKQTWKVSVPKSTSKSGTGFTTDHDK